MRYYKRGFDFGDFTITKREIIFSIAIIAIMLILGMSISNVISQAEMDRNEMYNQSLQIDTTELFRHGMDTNVGNAFVYGDLVAVDTVTYPEIGGKYMYVKKVKERYTKHTRTVKYTDSNGKTKTRKETYWSWDRVGSEDKQCNEVSFCNIVFDTNKINIPDTYHIDTIKESSHVRYKYYGTGTKFTGTIFTELKDKTISNNTQFYNNKTINETTELLQSGGGVNIFWFFWLCLIGLALYGFYYIDNNWLEE